MLLKKFVVFYKGIINDLKRTINNCSICQIKNKKIDLKKKINTI